MVVILNVANLLQDFRIVRTVHQILIDPGNFAEQLRSTHHLAHTSAQEKFADVLTVSQQKLERKRMPSQHTLTKIDDINASAVPDKVVF